MSASSSRPSCWRRLLLRRAGQLRGRMGGPLSRRSAGSRAGTGAGRLQRHSAQRGWPFLRGQLDVPTGTRCSSTSARRTRCRTSSSVRISSASRRSAIPIRRSFVAIQMYLGTFQQHRTIWMDGRPHPPDYAPHTFMGFSTGDWNGDILTITTTHIKAGYFRRTGVPASDRTTVVEHWMRHGNAAVAGDDRHRSGVSERAVHPEPGIRADGARQHELALQLRIRRWRCRGQEPRCLTSCPARTRWCGEFAAKHAMPQEGVRGGAETLLPGWKPGAPPAAVRGREERRLHGLSQPERICSRATCGRFTCRATCYMIVGAGANIAVQVGEDGVSWSTPVPRADRQGAGGDQGAGEREGNPLDRQHDVSSGPYRRQRGVLEGRPHGQRQSRRDRRARERRRAHGSTPKCPTRRGRSTPTSRRRATSRSTANRSCSITTPRSTDTDTMVMFRRSDVIVAGEVYSNGQLSGDRSGQRRQHPRHHRCAQSDACCSRCPARTSRKGAPT